MKASKWIILCVVVVHLWRRVLWLSGLENDYPRRSAQSLSIEEVSILLTLKTSDLSKMCIMRASLSHYLLRKCPYSVPSRHLTWAIEMCIMNNSEVELAPALDLVRGVEKGIRGRSRGVKWVSSSCVVVFGICERCEEYPSSIYSSSPGDMSTDRL